jgi:glycosyltransferase involved in cell wall biosynthesis
MQRYLHRLTRTTQFDVIQLEAVFFSRYLQALPGIPVVVNHHNVESQLLQRRAASQRTPWARAFFEREARKVGALECAVVPRAAQNLVVSDLDGERLREVAAGAKITTVPNGVDVEYFRARSSAVPETKSLVFAGGMNWFPNRDAIAFFVSEIWPTLARDDPLRTVTVIGRDPPAVVRAAGRDPRVRVLGFVEDVRPHLEAASIYVCPIRVGGGTRLKILDALAMSRPLVATDLAVEGLGLIEGKHYLSANTPEQFIVQIRRLENDADLRRRMGDAGRALVVERYSWRRIAESLEDAYAEVAQLA